MSMYYFPQQESAVKRALNRCIGPNDLKIDLSHALSSEWGLLSSDVAIQAGRALRRPPEDIAKELVVALTTAGDSYWGSVNQVLTFCPPSDLEKLDVLRQASWREQTELKISVWCSALDSLCGQRLLASAACQASALIGLGHKPALWLNGQQQSWHESIRPLFNMSLADTKLELSAEEPVHCAWVAPAAAAKEGSLYKSARYVNVTSKIWSAEGTPKLQQLVTPRSALYLASGMPANELDPFVPSAMERANLAWFMESTLRRTDQLLAGVEVKKPATYESADWLLKLERWRFVLADLAWKGAVIEGIDFFDGLLKEINFFINQIRLSGAARVLSYQEVEILSSVHVVLSDTMQHWSVLSHI